MEAKSIWTSKTFYLNIALVLAAVLQQYFGVDLAPQDLEIFIAAALNIAVRFLTTQPVTLKKG